MGAKRGGFSLIELLVVIGIIGILLAIIVPIYGRAKEKARQADCMAHLHSIAAAVRMYRDDWGRYPDVHRMDGATDPTSRRLSGALVSLYVTGDMDDNVGLRCPDDRTDPADVLEPTDPDLPAVAYTSYNSWLNPNSDELEQLYNWYGYNADGRANETLAQAGVIYNGVTDALGRRMWAGYVDAGNPGLFTGAFRGLRNSNAPEGTVVTHCPHHRAAYRPGAELDIVVFLGGNVDTKRVAQFDWVRQQDY